jgi:diaminohydroxyphosphoribosylaminopyrimidine deaminase/5-amino-6-(5-phosphoribosylamino)uracil reductase
MSSDAPTIVFTKRGAPAARARALRAAGAEVVEVPAPRGRLSVPAVLRALAEREVQSVLVEGGAGIHGAFIASGLVDRVALFVAPILLGAGVPIAAGLGRDLGHALALGELSWRRAGRDLLLTADAGRPRS